MPSPYGTKFDAIAVALADGNLQAYDVCRHLYTMSPRVDLETPDQLLVMRTLLQFDLRGDQLVRLYEHGCKKNLGLVMAVAHALRLKFRTLLQVKTGLTNPDLLDFRGMLAQIREVMPSFAPNLMIAYATTS
jgi:hypothetical protein